jgi:hypothetical protein
VRLRARTFGIRQSWPRSASPAATGMGLNSGPHGASPAHLGGGAATRGLPYSGRSPGPRVT